MSQLFLSSWCNQINEAYVLCINKILMIREQGVHEGGDLCTGRDLNKRSIVLVPAGIILGQLKHSWMNHIALHVLHFGGFSEVGKQCHCLLIITLGNSIFLFNFSVKVETRLSRLEQIYNRVIYIQYMHTPLCSDVLPGNLARVHPVCYSTQTAGSS